MKKIFPLFAVIIVLVLAVCSFHIIPTGYTGVKTSFGQIPDPGDHHPERQAQLLHSLCAEHSQGQQQAAG